MNNLTVVSTGRAFDLDVNKISRRDDWVAIQFDSYFEKVSRRIHFFCFSQ